MNFLALPWVLLSIASPLLGAAAVRFVRRPADASGIALVATLLALGTSGMAWIAQSAGITPNDPLLHWLGRSYFRIDTTSAPLLPLVALLHVLTVLTTARVKMNRMSFTGHLVGASIRLATFCCVDTGPLIVCFTLSTIPPYLEILSRGKSTRIYLLHMALFVGLLGLGWLVLEVSLTLGVILWLAAVLIRCGSFPAHLWVADLFENATFGTALLYVTPIAGVYATLRLVMPIAPDWALQSIGLLSLATAVYASGLALVQTDARRFFAYLFLSLASLILIGLELHTPTSLTGSLCLWTSTALSLGGLGMILRALEARYGRLSLNKHLGLYEQSPMLAVGFLLMGLCCVGFPGTLGFIASEVLIDGIIEANVIVGIGFVLTTALNGIAIVKVYLILFTGPQSRSPVPMPITPRERTALLVLCALIIVGGLFPGPGVVDRHEAALKIVQHRETSRP